MSERYLTREEMYDLVWSKPVHTLAPEFHLSDVGFAKLCRRHAIPLPGRGYWAKKEHGKKVLQPKLPVVKEERLKSIRIHVPEVPALTAEPEENPEVASWIERERMVENRIVVPPEVHKYHPLVRATRDWFADCRKKHDYNVKREHIDHLHVKVTREAEQRALHLLDAVITSCEQRGWSVETTSADRDTATTISLLGEKVKFLVEERLDRRPHELTTAQQKLADENRLYPRPPKYDYFGTGVLKLTVDELWSKVTFTDRKDRPLESQLNDFIIALVRVAVLVVRPRRIEAEERDRAWKDRERRAAIEHRRRSQFDELLTKWNQHEAEKDCFAAVEAVLAASPNLAGNENVREWIEGHAADWSRTVLYVPT